jgi:F-type H+-transporting ATPase subunit a
MIVNLFSVFDPRTQFIRINWLRLLLFIYIIPWFYWIFRANVRKIWKIVWGVLYSEFKLLLGVSSGLGVILLVLSLFSFILVNNVLGLAPYIFTGTSHFSVTVSLALPLWVGLILYGWINHAIDIFAHLVPQGTPGALLVFMVLIERVRIIIRPLTLSVRLGANIIAGHLLLTLIGGQAGGIGLIPSLVRDCQMLLIMLELAVAFIQAYVFVTLITLYFGEVNYDKLHSFISYGG